MGVETGFGFDRFAAEALADPHPLYAASRGAMLLNEDPPAHGRTRALVGEAFSPRRVRRLEPRIRELTEELLDGLTGGRGDLVRQLTMPPSRFG